MTALPEDVVTHRQGCDALGGYGHGKGPCTCGAHLLQRHLDDAVVVPLDQNCLPNGVMFDAFGEPRKRYVRVIFDGTTCVVDPVNVADTIGEDDPKNYVLQDTHLSEREFEDLPEFDGF
jgi:hypothetical protein